MCKRALEGKRVLLTGGSSGIGWYLATQLINQGAYVVVTSRRDERLRQLRLAVGNPLRRLIALPGDVADPAHRELLIKTAHEQLGGIDLVINNAGIGAVGAFEKATPERLRRIFEVDFFAVTELTRLALPLLHKGVSPAVCIVSSVLAHRGVPRKSEYCAAKFALRGWSESLRLELKPSGIDMITVSPSTTKSEFFESLLDTEPTERSRSFGMMTAEAVAGSILGAIRKGKRELILSPGGKALVWLSRLAPTLTDNLLLKYAA
ncbi:MAG: SDR family NAD(P)-dependent oxidoreductase [Pirellulaceae bacterium]|nr:SDR family NAD(P)-dependent oxidoreductase [Pirellulaceae bacterium]